MTELDDPFYPDNEFEDHGLENPGISRFARDMAKIKQRFVVWPNVRQTLCVHKGRRPTFVVKQKHGRFA